MLDFWEGRFDVLVCTTIIESGIDMPTVNTLVVERADLLGLGQMHQLRGRVGRSGSRAYAYLFHPRDKVLSEEAYERLKTIGEATDLGSGFKIAMRDLEIRGAGNMLGQAQSGHIAAVGYDLYCQMVTEAVSEMKGETKKEPNEVKLDVPTDAHLPATYVPKEELRLEAYRRLAAITSDSRRRRHPQRMGRPLRPAARGRRIAADDWPSACRLQSTWPTRHHHQLQPGPARSSCTQNERGDAIASFVSRRAVQGRPKATGRTHQEGCRPSRRSSSSFLRELIPPVLEPVGSPA